MNGISQIQALNKVLHDKSVAPLVINNITEAYFPDFKDEFKYVMDHYNTYNQVPDLVTFLAQFPNFDVVEVTESDKYLVDSLIRDKRKYDLAIVFNKIRKSLNEDDVESAYNVYLNSVDSAVQSKQIDSVDILKDTSRYSVFVDKMQDFNKYYVSTGFDELDQIIGGWDKQEEVATIVARPGVGKSWVLLKIASAAAEKGMRVGLYSGEMSVNKVGFRYDTLESHISNYDLLRGSDSICNEYKKYIDDLPQKYTGCLEVLTPDMINGPATVTALRAFIEKKNLDMLCIDQYSLLDDEHHARTPQERTANISKDIKNLQVLKHIPIISVSQQNRENTEEGVTLANVAVSDRIGQDSTLVIFLEQKENVLTLHLVKSRDSGNGKNLKYAIDLNKGLFQYIPNEDSAVGDAGVKELKSEFDGENVF